jgi:hypothetical protein
MQPEQANKEKKMNKYYKNAPKKFLKNFTKWEESKAIGKAEMLLALVSMCAIGFLFGCFS